MNEEHEMIVTIHLIDGEELKFAISPSEAKQIGVSDDIENALQRNSMAIEMDNKLIVIPYTNVRYIEVDPAPASLPLSIITGARKID